MDFLSVLIIILALPLFIVYGISDKKNKTWLRLGGLLVVTGILMLIAL
jgi:hypothetical protein